MSTAELPFPLIRWLSRPLTGVLAATPLSANVITTLSLVAGLGTVPILLAPGPWTGTWAGVLMVLCYVLDNCDGEIARLKDQCSEFGMRYDSFVDWVVHTAFFAALGEGQASVTGEHWWAWAGWAAAAGGTINYLLGFALDHFDQQTVEEREQGDYRPQTRSEWVLFAFRELTRADFCFIVLALGIADVLWVLLPAGAIGAQVYWITQFQRSARRFHV